MIILFTDFGLRDPYIGQVQAILHELAPDAGIINLFPELKPFAIQEAAYLLGAYQEEFPTGTVFLSVVDPGVGTGRLPVILKARDKWFVGPDNGLLDVVKKRCVDPKMWRIDEIPEYCSTTFHGRDIFAPIAAALSNGTFPGVTEILPALVHDDWPDDLLKIIYCDHYGNAITGIRSGQVSEYDRFIIAGRELSYCRTFAEAGTAPFWYYNSNGLVEFAMNQSSISDFLALTVGDDFQWHRAI